MKNADPSWKIEDLSNKMGELVMNQMDTAAQLAGFDSRTDNLDSHLTKLEQVSKAKPVEAQAPPSTTVWGDLPCAPASQPSRPSPSPSSSALRVFAHWDRIADPTILKVDSNKNRIALTVVGDAFKVFFFRHTQCVSR